MPHDFVVPGAISTGDIPSLAAAIAPRPLRVESAVTGVNRLAETQLVNKEWQFATDIYTQQKAKEELLLKSDRKSSLRWLAETLTSAK